MNSIYRFLILCFLEGAAVMVCELAGQRMMVPLFGSTLRTWGVIISITMIGLGGGYFLGGKLSSASQPFKTAVRLLAGAGFFTALMPWLGEFVLTNSARFNFTFGLFISPTIYLFPPLLLMGAFSPVMIAVMNATGVDAGNASGRVYATSTLGGILATLLTSFFLLESIGIRYTLLLVGTLLMVAAAIAGWRSKGWLVMALLPLLIQLSSNKKVETEHFKQQFLVDGPYGQLRIIDASRNSDTTWRFLMNNNVVQSFTLLPEMQSSPEYIESIASFVQHFGNTKHIGLLGLGGGQMAKILLQKGFTPHCIEIDPTMVQLAYDYFNMPKEIDVAIGDARLLLRQLPACDIIIADFFASESLPNHLFVVEYFKEIYATLPENGIFLINTYGYTDSEKGKVNRAILSTLKVAGFMPQFFAPKVDPNHRNGLIIAQKSTDPAVQQFMQVDNNYSNYSADFELDSSLAYTDNRSSMETDLLKATSVWRKNYYLSITKAMIAEGLPLF